MLCYYHKDYLGKEIEIGDKMFCNDEEKELWWDKTYGKRGEKKTIHSVNRENDATILLSLEALIKSHIESINFLKGEKNKRKEMLSDALIGDAVYQEHDKLAKSAVKTRNATKAQILRQAQNVKLSHEVKSLSTELKDKQLALSDYLLEYQRQTGVNEIEDNQGNVLFIVNTAKVQLRLL